MKFFGKRNQILKQTFSYKMKLWNDIFSKFQIVNWEIFVPAHFENKIFRIIILRGKVFCGKNFLSSIFLRNQISIKKSHLRNKVLNWFAPRKTTNFSIFVPIIQGMILKTAFWLKIRVWKEFLSKRYQIMKQIFPTK